MSKPFSAVPWSYTMLTSFETCPRKFMFTKVTKEVTEDFGPAAGEGIKIHNALEKYGTGQAALPSQYEQFKPIVDKVLASKGEKRFEYKFGITQSLQPTRFFGSDVWYRGALDVTVIRGSHGIVLDWKNGKRKSDIDQLKLFAAAAFSLFPAFETVTTGYVWLTANKVDPETFTKDDAPKIWQEFAIRVHRLENALATNNFPPNPSGLCKKYCPVGKSRCEHCGTN